MVVEVEEVGRTAIGGEGECGKGGAGLDVDAAAVEWRSCESWWCASSALKAGVRRRRGESSGDGEAAESEVEGREESLRLRKWPLASLGGGGV